MTMSRNANPRPSRASRRRGPPADVSDATIRSTTEHAEKAAGASKARSSGAAAGSVASATDWLRRITDGLPAQRLGDWVDAQRKDTAALLEAHEQAWRGTEALLHRQREMLGEARAAWRSAGIGADGETAPKSARPTAEVWREQWQRMPAQARELAELSAKAHQQVWRTLGQRAGERLTDAWKTVSPAAAAGGASPRGRR
jgi:hypothetical protein